MEDNYKTEATSLPRDLEPVQEPLRQIALEPVQESLRQIALEPCKLTVLYMVYMAREPINTARISEFILGEDYANYRTLQTALSDLFDGGFVARDIRDNRTFLSILGPGEEAIEFFKSRLDEGTRENVKNYLKDNVLELREEASIRTAVRAVPEGGFRAELSVREGRTELISLSLHAPTEDLAEGFCESWKSNYSDIYNYLISKLL